MAVTSTQIGKVSALMEELLSKAPDIVMPKPGTLVDGFVISIYKNKILVDLNGLTTGLITGREAKDSGDTIKKLKVGDTIVYESSERFTL